MTHIELQAVVVGDISLQSCLPKQTKSGISTAVSVDHVGILRSDCSGETRLGLHIPSSSRA